MTTAMLVAEDELDVQCLFGIMLKMAGSEVLTAVAVPEEILSAPGSYLSQPLEPSFRR